MRLGIEEYFDSSHYLPEHSSCGVTHGHTYKVEVIIEGEKKGKGMIVDFHDIRQVVKGVLVRYDHRLLNDLMEYPSAENICEAIYRDIRKKLDFPLVIRLWEGRGKWVEFGD